MQLVDTQSNIKYYMLDKQFLIDTFGTETPSVTEKTNKFFELWCEWRQNRLLLKRKKNQVLRLLSGIGLIPYRDFQLKNNEIRFRHADDLAFAKLCLNEIIENV